MGSSSKITIVIVSYNGRKYLPDCFNSLGKQTLLPEEIIVIDNASTDGSQEFLSKFKVRLIEPHAELDGMEILRVKVIFNNKNSGFARANNQGIEIALRNKSDYIFLLNQDTVCRPDCLEKLVEWAEREKKNVFAWQPMILCWPQKDLIQTAGDKIHYLGFGFCGDYKKPINQLSIINNQLSDITYASGAAMFINAGLLSEVGLLDRDLFLYHEDLDLCLRARFLGYEIKLAPAAIIYHKYTEGIPKHRWYWSERNRLLTLLKFYKWQTLILVFPAWLFMEGGVLSFSLMTGWFHLKLKSYFTCLWQIPKTLIKRKKLQKIRKIKDRQLAEFLEAEFSFAGFENQIIKKIVNPILGTYWRLARKIIFW